MSRTPNYLVITRETPHLNGVFKASGPYRAWIATAPRPPSGSLNTVIRALQEALEGLPK